MVDRREAKPRRNQHDRRSGDRRESQRSSQLLSVRFLCASGNVGELIHGSLQNVSPLGLQLQLDRHIQPGEKMLVEVLEDGRTVFNLNAKAIWSESAAGGSVRIGCELRPELTDRQHALLMRIVEQT
ncbi:MAG: PilZ domain-containing protein [Planctomycetaceae bacterium]